MVYFREFIKGFLGLNLYLTPFHFYFIFVRLHPATERMSAFMDIKAEAFYFFVFYEFLNIFGSQILVLLSLFIFAKLWDLIYLKLKFYSETVSVKGVVFGALISAIIVTIFGNIYIDHLYQFKGKNYFVVIIPFWITLFYHTACYTIGRTTIRCINK